MIGACSLSPLPRCSWSPSLLGWGEHGLASSRGSALDLSNWARQRGQRLRRGSQAAETRSSRTELDLLGDADLAPVRGEDKTCFQGTTGAQDALHNVGQAPVRMAQKLGNPGEGSLAQFRQGQRKGGGPAAGGKLLGQQQHKVTKHPRARCRLSIWHTGLCVKPVDEGHRAENRPQAGQRPTQIHLVWPALPLALQLQCAPSHCTGPLPPSLLPGCLASGSPPGCPLWFCPARPLRAGANSLSHCSLLPICMWLLCLAARWSRAPAV